MPTSPDAASGEARSPREDLAALARHGIDWHLPADRRLAHPEVARRSAVLALFGPDEAGTASAPTRARLGGVDVLLVRRAATLRHHAGQFAFPGGGFEEHDTSPSATALREAVEETGVDASGVDVLGELPALPVPVSRNLVTPVLGWWRSPSAVYPADQRETAEVFRMPMARLVDPASRVRVRRVLGHSVMPMPAFLVDDRLIWGFTAIVLAGLIDALGWSQPWDRERYVTIDD